MGFSVNESIILELINDYEENKIWKPLKERHNWFPELIQKKITFFLLVIKKFSLNCFKQKIPKPLLWMIINKFVISNPMTLKQDPESLIENNSNSSIQNHKSGNKRNLCSNNLNTAPARKNKKFKK